MFFFLYSRLKCHRNSPTRHYRNDASFNSAHQQNSTCQTPANKTCRCIVAQSLHKNAQECRLTKIQTFRRETYEASWYGCKRKRKHLIVPASIMYMNYVHVTGVCTKSFVARSRGSTQNTNACHHNSCAIVIVITRLP